MPTLGNTIKDESGSHVGNFDFSSNKYLTANANNASAVAFIGGNFLNFQQYQNIVGELNPSQMSSLSQFNFCDPERDAGRYVAYLKLYEPGVIASNTPETLEGLVQEAMKFDRDNISTKQKLFAPAINDYFRKGFGAPGTCLPNSNLPTVS